MRKIPLFIGTLSTESLNVDGQNIALLSDEELEVMTEEADAAKAEGDANLGEVERFIDVTDTMQDVADTLESNGESMGEDVTPAEAALVDASAQAAVAGTATPNEEIMPVMESYVGQNRRLAVESIREKASQLYEAVIKFLKKVWENIEKFAYKYIGEIPLLRRKLDALKTRVEETASKSLKKEGGRSFKITSGTGVLMSDTQPIKDNAALQAVLATTETMATYVFGTYADNVKKRGDSLVDAISDFDADKADEAGAAAMKELAATRFNVPGTSTNDSRFSGYDCEVAAGMMSNKSLARRTWKDRSEKGLAAGLNRMRFNSVLMVSTVEKPKDPPADITFTTLSTPEMSKVISKIEKLLDVAEQFRRGSKFKQLKDVREKMKNASSKATTNMRKLESEENRTQANIHATAIYKEMINLNVGFADWVKNPIEPMVQLTMSSARAAMMVVSRSCSQYE